MSHTTLYCPSCDAPVPARVQMIPAPNVSRYTCPSCGRVTLREELVRKHNRSVFLGGYSSAVQPFAFAGSGAGTSGSGTFTVVPGVSVPGGSTVVMFVFIDGALGGPSGATWNGVAMTEASVSPTYTGGAGDMELHGYYLENCSAATGDFAVTIPNTTTNWVAIAAVLPTAAASSIDRGKANSGSNASPTSTATLATNQGSEVLVGAIGWRNDSPGGSWSNSFTSSAAKSSGSSASAEIGSRIVNATGTYTAAKTGCANTDWAAMILTFKLS